MASRWLHHFDQLTDKKYWRSWQDEPAQAFKSTHFELFLLLGFALVSFFLTQYFFLRWLQRLHRRWKARSAVSFKTKTEDIETAFEKTAAFTPDAVWTSDGLRTCTMSSEGTSVDAAENDGSLLFPAYASEHLVEFFDASRAQWVNAISFSHLAKPDEQHIEYYVLVLDHNPTQQVVSLDMLREPLIEGESCEVFLASRNTWVDAVVTDRMTSGVAIMYSIKEVFDDDEEELEEDFASDERKVPASLVRRRYLPGSVVEVYHGEQMGWVPSTVLRQRVTAKPVFDCSTTLGSVAKLMWTQVAIRAKTPPDSTPVWASSYLVRPAAIWEVPTALELRHVLTLRPSEEHPLPAIKFIVPRKVSEEAGDVVEHRHFRSISSWSEVELSVV